jgi:hypothetical protein
VQIVPESLLLYQFPAVLSTGTYFLFDSLNMSPDSTTYLRKKASILLRFYPVFVLTKKQAASVAVSPKQLAVKCFILDSGWH